MAPGDGRSIAGDHRKYGPQFASLLREVRRVLDVSQEVGEQIGLGSGAWQSYEQQAKVPTIPNLFRIPRELVRHHPTKPVPSPARFLAEWLAAHEDVAVDEAIIDQLRAAPAPRMSLTDLSWLEAYLFTGDRRERQATTRLDCLIGDASTADLRQVFGLGLGRETLLVTDKHLTARPWVDLVAQYGTRDVVSISSGSVNAMTALLNDDMVFRFDVVPEARAALRTFVRGMDHLESEVELGVFQACLAAADRVGSTQDPTALLEETGLPATDRNKGVAGDVATLLGGPTPRQFTSLFRQAVVDPVRRTRLQPERNYQYAVISFARHPFGSPDHVALVVAGTNGSATAGALDLLAGGRVVDRPLGAAVRVHVRDDGAGRSKVLVPEIVTPPYEPADIVRSIDSMIPVGDGGPPTTLRRIFGNWTRDELGAWKSLVEDLAARLGR